MNSVFEIPILSMDEQMPVIADTTAMGPQKRSSISDFLF